MELRGRDVAAVLGGNADPAHQERAAIGRLRPRALLSTSAAAREPVAAAGTRGGLMAKRRGRPRADSPKERVGVRIPLDVFEIYDKEERQSGVKATTTMARVLTLHAQTI